MDDSWKSCENCADVFCPYTEDEACKSWLPLECRRCGGTLSITRYHNGRRYRHCFSCHAEFFEEDPDV